MTIHRGWVRFSLTFLLMFGTASAAGQQAANTRAVNRPTSACDQTKLEAEKQVKEFEELIRRHQRAIRNLNPSFTVEVEEIEGWESLATETRQEKIRLAKELAAELMWERMVGATLRKIELYPISVTDVIKRYQIRNPKLQEWLWRWARLNVDDPLWADKAKLAIAEFGAVRKLVRFSTGYERADWDEYVQLATDFFPVLLKSANSPLFNRLQLGPLRHAGLALLEARWAWASVWDNVTRRTADAKIDAITSLTEQQLRALDRLSYLLQRDIDRLKSARENLAELGTCSDELDWQVSLQRQRLNAISGDIAYYAQLLTNHERIFRSVGLRPCESIFYPLGCGTSRSSTSVDTRPDALNDSACVSFTPREGIEALRIEGASHKNACWSRGPDRSLYATGAPPDKNYKPLSKSANEALSINHTLIQAKIDGLAQEPPAPVSTPPVSTTPLSTKVQRSAPKRGGFGQTVSTGNGVAIAPGWGKHAYVPSAIDLTGFTQGGLLHIEVSVGSGDAALSFDLYPGGKPLAQSGLPTDHGTVAHVWNVPPGARSEIAYRFSSGQVFTLGVTGNWQSPAGSKNSYVFRAWVTE